MEYLIYFVDEVAGVAQLENEKTLKGARGEGER